MDNDVLQRLVGLKVKCLSCENEFVVSEGNEIVYFKNDPSRYNMRCPKCDKLVDFVVVPMPK